MVGSGAHAHLDPAYNSSAFPDMPSLDRPAGGALALHYAAARGCIDCVRLLVEASPEIRWVPLIHIHYSGHNQLISLIRGWNYKPYTCCGFY